MLRGREDRFTDSTRAREIFTIGLELNSKDHFRSVILASKYGQTKCTFPFFCQAKKTGAKGRLYTKSQPNRWNEVADESSKVTDYRA